MFSNKSAPYNYYVSVYCSKSEKGDKELMVKEALASTKLWEARSEFIKHTRNRKLYCTVLTVIFN